MNLKIKNTTLQIICLFLACILSKKCENFLALDLGKQDKDGTERLSGLFRAVSAFGVVGKKYSPSSTLPPPIYRLLEDSLQSSYLHRFVNVTHLLGLWLFKNESSINQVSNSLYIISAICPGLCSDSYRI